MDFNFLPWLYEFFAAVPGGEHLWTVIAFIIVLSVLVFFHELGHYLAARSVGVGVKAFSIGFGKEIKGWDDKHGTRWKICMVPLGGYVSMVGEDSNEEDKKAYKKGTAFFEKHVWQRIWVVAAGPLANFILAFVFLAAIFMTGEKERVPLDETPAIIGGIHADMPAAKGGMKIGDKIFAINGKVVKNFQQLSDLVAKLGDKRIPFIVIRDGEYKTLNIAPQIIERFNPVKLEMETRALIGIGPESRTRIVEHTVISAIKQGFVKTAEYSTLIIKTVGAMIAGSVPSDSVGGPIMIADMASKSAQTGGYELILFMAVISINLGMINLFPIPMLDGGHLLYYFVELIKGSPVSDKMQYVGQRIGLALILMLMCFAFYNDIIRLIKNF
jgi:regulator of sigma E protease